MVVGAGQRQPKKDGNLQFRPLCDGVFRAVPPTVNAREFCGKILQQVLRVMPACTDADCIEWDNRYIGHP